MKAIKTLAVIVFVAPFVGIIAGLWIAAECAQIAIMEIWCEA